MTKSEPKTTKKKKSTKLPTQVDLAIAAAEDKQAVNVVVLDLRKTAGFTDFFVIASGTNTRQVRAIADAVWNRWRQRARSRRTSRATIGPTGSCSTTSTSSSTSSAGKRARSTISSAYGAAPIG